MSFLFAWTLNTYPKCQVSTVKPHTKTGFAILTLKAAAGTFGRFWLDRESQCTGLVKPFPFPMGCLI